MAHGREGDATPTQPRQRKLPAPHRFAVLAAAACLLALLTACSGPAPARHTASHRSPAPDASRVSPLAAPAVAAAQRSPSPSPASHGPVPAYCGAGGARLWANLAACDWPGPANTGPDLSQCPGGRLTSNAGSLGRTIVISSDNTVVSCENITGMIDIQAQNVTIRNSIVTSNSGKTGEDANGTSDILVDTGASATIDHVTINGDDGVHACIWHEGTKLLVNAVNCYGIDDGIFSWSDTSYSGTTGDNFVIENSYFHDFTAVTSNGHEDGYQTEGASNGVIEHNTYLMTTDSDSAIAIWDMLRNSSGITVRDNLITGGGFAIYAEDYNPGDSGPGDPSAVGGFSTTQITFTGNVFSTFAGGCVGQFGVWFDRPAWAPYDGGPTDTWHRSGNKVLETGENVDNGNPHANGGLCQ
jgi:hypothetical protein